MTRYPVYLEIGGDGLTMAHVLELLGCIVRAPTKDEALRRLPEVIHDYHAWLHRHGEPVPSEEEPIEVEIAGESIGFGPFNPGDAAALFPPDRQPVTSEEMEYHFRLMTHARTDLLTLVRDLSDDVVDWQADRQAFSIRHVLRHIGNAEEWYVSRIVPPETLPPEWEHDKDLPIFHFLEMERCTAVARLRQLTEEERAGVFYPTCWTSHPEEPWTARKVLRRFLEHEREHTVQVREIMAAWRTRLMARLASERAGLLAQLTGLDERILTETPVFDDWTTRDILAHIAAWDRWELREMSRMLGGEAPDLTAVRHMDAFNAGVVAAWRDRAVSEVLAELRDARAAWAAWMQAVSEEEFFRRRLFEGVDWCFRGCVEVQLRHDAEHASQLAAWRQAHGVKNRAGSKAVLLVALDAGRAALLALAGLIPNGEQASRPVVGAWTLKDVLGHVVDWEWVSLGVARQMAAGRLPQVDYPVDVDAWNQAHVTARRDQPWETIWADLEAARRALMIFLEEASQADLDRPAPGRWGPVDTAYNWAYACLDHDLEHVADLRKLCL